MLEHFFNEPDEIYDLKKITLLFLILLLTLATIFQKKMPEIFSASFIREAGGLHMNSFIDDAFRGGLITFPPVSQNF